MAFGAWGTEQSPRNRAKRTAARYSAPAESEHGVRPRQRLVVPHLHRVASPARQPSFCCSIATSTAHLGLARISFEQATRTPEISRACRAGAFNHRLWPAHRLRAKPGQAPPPAHSFSAGLGLLGGRLRHNRACGPGGRGGRHRCGNASISGTNPRCGRGQGTSELARSRGHHHCCTHRVCNAYGHPACCCRFSANGFSGCCPARTGHTATICHRHQRRQEQRRPVAAVDQRRQNLARDSRCAARQALVPGHVHRLRPGSGFCVAWTDGG